MTRTPSTGKPGKRAILADSYRLDRLLVPRTDPRTGKLKLGFETVAECVAEDQIRAQLSGETAEKPSPKVTHATSYL